MRNSIPFAWMGIPDKYRDDETLHRMYADFVSEADWKHERLMKAIEQHKKNYFSSDDELIVIDEDERFKE
jgi:arylsulfatase A-like enzyme